MDGGGGGSSDKAVMDRAASGGKWRGPGKKRGSKVREM